ATRGGRGLTPCVTPASGAAATGAGRRWLGRQRASHSRGNESGFRLWAPALTTTAVGLPASRSAQRLDVLARHPRDVRDGNVLRADRLALAFVGAAPEPSGVGLLDHRDDTAPASELALRQP